MTIPATPTPRHGGDAITGHIMTPAEIVWMDFRHGMFAPARTITMPRPCGVFDNPALYRDGGADSEVIRFPARIAESRVDSVEAVPAWMIGATAAQAHRGL